MGCTIKDKNLKGKIAGDLDLEQENGLIVNHPYTIVEVMEVNGVRLVKMRNPWGHGGYKGSFSDHDVNVSDDFKKALKFSQLRDGLFYMKFADLCQNFTKI